MIPVDRLYFGYGSNLDAQDLTRWCARHGFQDGFLTAVRPAWLPDRKLAFDHRSDRRRGGTLNVPEAVGCAVPGVLFQVTGAGWEVLDEKEGYSTGTHYVPIDCVAIDLDGDEVQVVTYVSARPDPPMPPAKGYFEVVARGYRAHGLPLEFLRAAADDEVHPVDQLFVYGSLKEGRWLSGELAGFRLETCTAQIAGDLYDLGEYPGYRSGDGVVHGERCRVRDVAGALAHLDAIEGFEGYGDPANLFRRVLVETGPDGVLAWAYRWVARGEAALVPGGVW